MCTLHGGGLDERYKDVAHKDTVKVGGSTRPPDYSFRIGGMCKFFVEAKKPALNLREDPASKHRIGYYTYRDYIEKWDEIAAIFSKQGILTGGYDDYTQALRQKKGGRGLLHADPYRGVNRETDRRDPCLGEGPEGCGGAPGP
jgi:hypothetical protein